MAKRLFLMLFSAILGITFVPETLAQADTFSVSAVDFQGVETRVTEALTETTTQPAIATVTAPAPVNYTVTKFVNSEDEYVALASNLSYSDIYRYQKLIYGHNSTRLLGNLSARYVGETITITEAGTTKTYRVADIQLYEKTADGRLNGTPRLMNKIARTALGHDVALMTCAGTPDGKGGASHRLVVFADAM